MSVKMRQEVERKIVREFVEDALRAGYRLTVSLERGYDVPRNEVDDDGTGAMIASSDVEKIMEAALSGDDCHIFVHAPTGPVIAGGVLQSEGWAHFVFGNDGWDVLSDYTVSLDAMNVLARAQAIADQYAD